MSSEKKALSLAELTAAILDPLMRKKAGINIALLENWTHIVGTDYAQTSLPVKILWPRRQAEVSDFEPGTLVVACEGFAALKLTHETTQVLNRINGFFGYHAVERIKIEQRPVRVAPAVAPVKKNIGAEEKQRLQDMTSNIEDEGLRQALIELGTGILSSRAERDKKFSK